MTNVFPYKVLAQTKKKFKKKIQIHFNQWPCTNDLGLGHETPSHHNQADNGPLMQINYKGMAQTNTGTERINTFDYYTSLKLLFHLEFKYPVNVLALKLFCWNSYFPTIVNNAWHHKSKSTVCSAYHTYFVQQIFKRICSTQSKSVSLLHMYNAFK